MPWPQDIESFILCYMHIMLYAYYVILCTFTFTVTAVCVV